ncbi:hypothetical protein JAAARDRAFT_144256, partial [Jaapia argillacea MUCL 33604]
VPKWHHNAHKGNCRYHNSAYFMPSAGTCDGETGEHEWAIRNQKALSTREMSAAHRHDAINADASECNQQKVFAIGRNLLSMQFAISLTASQGATC